MEDATAPAGLFLSLDQLIKKNTQVRRRQLTLAAAASKLLLIGPSHTLRQNAYLLQQLILGIRHQSWRSLQGRQQKGGRGGNASDTQAGSVVISSTN